MTEKSPDGSQVFISYNHNDREWLDRLLVHLKPLVRGRRIDIWSDTQIKPGDNWRGEIEDAIERAAVAILLVSADFLASDFIMTEELPKLLKKANARGATIIPVLVSPSLFEKHEELSSFQAVNAPSRTLRELSLAEREAVLVRVADSVAASVARLSSPATPDDQQRGPRRELFTDSAQWKRLIKIGEWSLTENGLIKGEGVYTYLLSERAYGDRAYMIFVKLRLMRYSEYADDGSCTANAGIVLGWNTEDHGPRYYNLLLNGKRMLLEEIGFRGDDEFVDYRHVNEGVPFPVEEGQVFSLAIRVSSLMHVWVDNRPIYSLPRPSRMIGKVGLRPWRSQMECTHFEVSYTGRT